MATGRGVVLPTELCRQFEASPVSHSPEEVKWDLWWIKFCRGSLTPHIVMLASSGGSNEGSTYPCLERRRRGILLVHVCPRTVRSVTFIEE
jgi:hypothetical protein